ncbi:MAG: hypothetical protein VX438_17765, partial [Planctomycetota bacterium]|nr:hypothetical protein [Planctomycetota bacterium]
PTCSEILEVVRAMGYVRFEIPTESEITLENEENPKTPAMRTSDVISSDLDQFDEFEESYEDDFEPEFDDE